MPDPGFVSGFIGVGIQLAIDQFVRHITIAVRCRNELSALQDVVVTIKPIITQIQQCRLQINRNRGISTSESVNFWLKKMDALLREASQMAEQCTISSCNIVSRYQTSKRITNLISKIDEHRKLVDIIHLAETEELLVRIGEYTQRTSVHASNSSASTSGLPAIASTSAGGFFIEEPLILGQEEAFARLENFVVEPEGEGNSVFGIGVVGKGGAGKTLLLKRVFNSQKVRDLFRDDLLLWLTVSNDPSFTNLRNELCFQIATLTKIDLDRNMREEDVKIWLNQRLRTQRFVLFLDDVWRQGAKLMEELGLPPLTHRSDSRLIVSSRDHGILSEMGIAIAETSRIRMGDLMEEDSWHLFANRAFPYKNGNLPANIDEKTAKVVCDSCGGLPLAIKVIGRAMASTTHPKEWEMAAQRFPVADSQGNKSSDELYDCLRLSYDALGNYDVNLQLCFLYAAAAFPKDEVVQVDFDMIPLWKGEGLLAGKKMAAGYDPFDMGRIYVDQLADRCLIEPMMRDIHGTVLCFRIHDVLRNLGIQIAEREESFYCRVGMGLPALNESECQGCTRILLNGNKLSSLPESLRSPAICSLLMNYNRGLAKIPKRVIGSMISLKTLDLSGTSISSLPNSVGGLKQLVCLKLICVPITRLPPSLVNLVNLEILDLHDSSIMELPSSLHKLRSLRYLDLDWCKDLQYLPRNISRITSLQSLGMYKCSKLWTTVEAKKKRCKKVASINNLGSLRNLKRLILDNNGETVEEGTLGNMAQMETLQLTLAGMASLPPDMGNMAKLKTFLLECSDVIKMGRNFFEFQNLTYLKLVACLQLEELPDLHKLRSLRELWIINCPQIKKFPEGFGETAGFLSLETFSLVQLEELEELPFVQEGAMPSLKIISIMECEGLQMLPQNYLNIKTLQKIRVFGCSKVLQDLEKFKIEKTKIEMITMSTIDTLKLREIYFDGRRKSEGWVYSEFWCNELFLFLNEGDRAL